MAKNASFFFDSWADTLYSYEEAGRPDLRNKMQSAIIDYIYLGREPEFEELELIAAWMTIKATAEPQKKEKLKAYKARQNGRKGGRPRKQKEEEPPRPRPEEPAPADSGTDGAQPQPPKASTASGSPATATNAPGRGRRPRHRNQEPPEASTEPDAPAAPSSTFHPPTLDEVRATAKELGIKRANIEKFFYHYEGKGWRAPNGHTLTNWPNKLLEWEAEEKEKGKPEAAAPPPRPRAPSSAVRTPPANTPPPDTSAGMQEEHKAVKPAEYIRYCGYDPEEWEGKYLEFLTMIREKEQPPEAV